MIWGHDYSTDLFVKLGILALFVAGYLVYVLIKKRRNNHDEDRKHRKSEDPNDTANGNQG